MFTLQLLGTASIHGPHGPVVGRAAHGTRLAVLALLDRARGRPLGRDKIVALLWPEASSERARPQLSDTLYILRTAFGDDVVQAVGDGLMLDADLMQSDVARFERLIDERRFEEAVTVYAGPLLDGFHLADAGEFQSWLDAERERLHRAYGDALQSLARASEAGGAPGAAIGWWRKLAAHDPYNGRVALQLMRALDAAGDRAGALQHARIHATMLREEFDAEPDAEVSALADRLRTDSVAHERVSVRTAMPVAGAVVSTPPVSPPNADASRATTAPTADAPAPLPSTGGEHSNEQPAPPARRWSLAMAGSAVAVLLLLSLAIFGSWRADASVVPTPPRSIGVLPFVNMSADTASYFSDGLSEQVIASLSRIDGLHVAARTSSFVLRGRALDVRAIGDTLGVDAVLEGSVRRSGQRLRVTAHLVDAKTGYRIWSDQYDTQLDDMIGVQDRIARSIADALEMKLVRSTSVTTMRRPPTPEAYDLYLRGLFLRTDFTGPALDEAVQYFDRAIALDSNFARAWAAKASVVAPQIYFGHVPVASGVRELRHLTARALELDSTLGEAHAARGILELFFDWNWTAAEKSLRRATTLNPSDPHAWHHLANYYNAMGRHTDAVAARKRSVDLDPLNARTRLTLGGDYLDEGLEELALAQLVRGIQLNPTHPIALGLASQMPAGPVNVYLKRGQYAAAVEELVRVARLRGVSPQGIDALRHGYRSGGMPGFWRAWLAMEKQSTGPTVNSLRFATVALLAGDTAQTLDYLDKAWAERNPGLIYLRHDPRFAGMVSHPRLQRIFAEMRFPEP